MNSEKRFCEYCAQEGKTCCQGREIYITPGDVRRISSTINNIDFYEFKTVSNPAYLDKDKEVYYVTT